MNARRQRDWTKLESAMAVVVVHAGLALALLSGFAPVLPEARERIMKLVDIAPEPPAPEPVAEPASKPVAPKEQGEGAPPAVKAQPAPIVAPRPEVRIEAPPLVATAPVAGIGNAVLPGLAPVEGPGTGRGGEGSGQGLGRGGDGTGGGGGAAVRTRRIRGHFTSDDYPRAAERAGQQGVTVARLDIGPDGRVARCRIHASSGSDILDGQTCRIILKRFRFEPARDAAGRPTGDLVEWEQNWSLRPEDRPETAQRMCAAEADRLPNRADRRPAFFDCMARLGWRSD